MIYRSLVEVVAQRNSKQQCIDAQTCNIVSILHARDDGKQALVHVLQMTKAIVSYSVDVSNWSGRRKGESVAHF